MIFKIIFPFLLLMMFSVLTFGQTKISFKNPSFEGKPAASTLPRHWKNSGNLLRNFPSILPGKWDVVMTPQDGKTYLGMVTRDNGTWEAVHQKMRKGLKAGVSYRFSLHLAQSDFFNSMSARTLKIMNFNQPVQLQIYGSKKRYGAKELLFESDLINHSDWRKIEVIVRPQLDTKFLIFEAAYDPSIKEPYNGHILLDHCSEISILN